MSIELLSSGYEQTLAIAKEFARVLRRGDIICLAGDLGAGKTAFVKGLAAGLGLREAHVHSPTFTLMNIYEGKIPLYHFDLYRICCEDLWSLGYEEFFYGQGITAVEWSERLENLMPKEFWSIKIVHTGQDTRQLTFAVTGNTLQTRFDQWVNAQ